MARGSIIRDAVSTAQALGGLREAQQTAPLRQRAAQLGVQQREQALRKGEMDIAQVEQGIAQSKRINDLIAVAQVPTEQRLPFLAQKRQEMALAGEDVTGIDTLMSLPAEDRDMRIAQGLRIAQAQGLAPGQDKDQRTSAEREFEFFQGLTPEDQATFLNVKRSSPGSKLTTVAGQKGAFNPRTEEFTPFSTAEQEREVTAQDIASEVEAKERTQMELGREESAPQRAEKVRSTVASVDNVISTVNEAIGLIGPGTAGFGSLLDFIPTAGARELKNAIATIQGNLGFDKLQSMRDASPTGGALGQVSERELNFLMSTISNLDTRAKPETLKKNLTKILKHYNNWRNAVLEARVIDLRKDGLEDDQVLQQISKEFPLPQ